MGSQSLARSEWTAAVLDGRRLSNWLVDCTAAQPSLAVQWRVAGGRSGWGAANRKLAQGRYVAFWKKSPQSSTEYSVPLVLHIIAVQRELKVIFPAQVKASIAGLGETFQRKFVSQNVRSTGNSSQLCKLFVFDQFVSSRWISHQDSSVTFHICEIIFTATPSKINRCHQVNSLYKMLKHENFTFQVDLTRAQCRTDGGREHFC